jgi:hypothetical protein
MILGDGQPTSPVMAGLPKTELVRKKPYGKPSTNWKSLP